MLNTHIHAWGIHDLAHLSVGGLHMRNIGVSFREPLETLPTSPAGGLHRSSALPLRFFSRTCGVFSRAVTLLILDGMNTLVPFSIVCVYTAAFCFCCHIPDMNSLQIKEIKAKTIKVNKKAKQTNKSDLILSSSLIT